MTCETYWELCSKAGRGRLQDLTTAELSAVYEHLKTCEVCAKESKEACEQFASTFTPAELADVHAAARKYTIAKQVDEEL